MSGRHFLNKRPDTILDWVAIVFAGIAFYLLLNNLGYFLNGFNGLMKILSPFAGGVVIAYILDPLVRFFHTKLLKKSKRWRWVAILLAYLVAVLLIVLLAWLVIPQIVNSIMMLFNKVPDYVNGLQSTLLFIQNRYGVDLQRAIQMLDDSEAMLNEVYSLGKTALPQIMSTICCTSCALWPMLCCPAVQPTTPCASATMPTIILPVSSSARSSTRPSLA